VPLLLVLFWEAFSRSGVIPASLLPAPSRVFATWMDWIFGINEAAQDSSGKWIYDAMASCLRVTAGYLIAALSGIA
ncbi:hypothetical protein ACP3WI_25115, partial [Salmonella enterica]